MGGIKRVIGIGFIWCVAAVGWMILGNVTERRTLEMGTKLQEGVENLWGNPQRQEAPALTFEWQVENRVQRTESKNGIDTNVSELVRETKQQPMLPNQSRIDVDLSSDLRRKGLMWYSLYDVSFSARYAYKHVEPTAGTLLVRFAFPDRNAIYDGFRFLVNGSDFAGAVDASDGSITARVPVAAGDSVAIQLGYKSRGLETWAYAPSQSVARLRDFELNLRTHFKDIDFPGQTLSPSTRAATDDGWKLQWKFEQIVSGFGIGMVMPSQIQPGELASALAFSAPISLFFYFLVIFVLATLRRIDIHPINYFFISGAFYAFHLLFAYTVNHLTIEAAFVLCSCVSGLLVVSYLRLVVSAQFALREAAIAQVIYQVGFSLAHFWEGFTGLTVTVLAILTLFALMQLTGRVKWSEVMAGSTDPRLKSA
jgi:inner membrane protein involved in colicin E2 resistance